MVLKIVRWNNLAINQLKVACDYIRHDSIHNAKIVRKDVLAIARSLAAHPEKYPPDKYKIDNDGSYRAFEVHHFRIIYRVLPVEIKILMLRHTSMMPIKY
jgi:plasmid stabilization system protein ParE